MERTDHKKKKSLNILWLLVIVIVLGTAAFGGRTYAKYLTARRAPENLMEAYNFYFTSNYLTDDATPPAIKVNAGTESFTIDLYNYDDELRASELDINYSVSVVRQSGTGTLDPAAAYPAGARVISKGPDLKSVSVTISGIENGCSYLVTATGSNGFTKTLKAVFNVEAVESKLYKFLKTSDDYLELTVWTEGDATGALSISYPAGLIPDNTDKAMRNWTSSSAVSTHTDSNSFTKKYSSHRYRFFYGKEVSGSDFNVEHFTVKIGELTAINKDPQSN